MRRDSRWGILRVVNGCAEQRLAVRKDGFAPEFFFLKRYGAPALLFLKLEQNMGIDLKFQRRTEYLYVYVAGDFSRNEALDGLDITLETAARYHITKVLIDGLALKGLPGNAAYHRYREALTKELDPYVTSGRILRLRIALILKEPLIDSGHFGEGIVIRQGVEGCLFNNSADALQWLILGSANRAETI